MPFVCKVRHWKLTEVDEGAEAGDEVLARVGAGAAQFVACTVTVTVGYLHKKET